MSKKLIQAIAVIREKKCSGTIIFKETKDNKTKVITYFIELYYQNKVIKGSRSSLILLSTN